MKETFIPIKPDYLGLLETSIPKSVKDILDDSPCVLAGGAIMSIILNHAVNDYDLFYEVDAQSHVEADMLAAAPANRWTLYAKSENGITAELDGLVCQFITNPVFCEGLPNLPLPIRVLANIDFTVCRMAVWRRDGKFSGFCDQQSRFDLEEKRLTYRRVPNPLGSLCRVAKYAHKGFKMPVADFSRLLARFVVEYRDAVPMEQPLDQTERQFADLFATKIPGCAVSPR